jgi:ribokinase
MDLAIRSKYFPQEGETLSGNNFTTCPGGKGLNQAIAIAKLGGKVHFLGAIGNDSFGKEMKDELESHGVDTRNIKIVDKLPSGVAIIIVVNGNNRIVLDLGANLKIEEKDIDKFLLPAKSGDIFLSQLENNIDATLYALRQAKKKGLITILNPAPANARILEAKSSIDYLIPNEIEVAHLANSSLDDAYKKIGVSSLLITLGEKGYRYQDLNGIISDHAIKVHAIDTTGAGDTFVGAFSYELSCGEDIKSSLRFACLAASISVTRQGSSKSSPTLAEMITYLEK